MDSNGVRGLGAGLVADKTARSDPIDPIDTGEIVSMREGRVGARGPAETGSEQQSGSGLLV